MIRMCGDGYVNWLYILFPYVYMFENISLYSMNTDTFSFSNIVHFKILVMLSLNKIKEKGQKILPSSVYIIWEERRDSA